jgi:hypothetical protein
MSNLSRQEFLQRTPRRYEDVPLPVKGGTVRIRSLTEAEKEAFEAAMLTDSGQVKRSAMRSARRRLILLCLVDDAGELLLQPTDIDALADLDGADLAVLQDAAMKHVGFKASDLDNLEKNSGAVRVVNS